MEFLGGAVEFDQERQGKEVFTRNLVRMEGGSTTGTEMEVQALRSDPAQTMA
jgi:hypothetical protein